MAKLEDDLKHIRTKAEEADKQYDEVSKKLQVGRGLILIGKPSRDIIQPVGIGG